MKYAEVFIEAFDAVMESFLAKQLVRADVKPREIGIGDRDICVFMGIVGDLSGHILMSMDEKTGKSLASEMMGGMEIAEVDELVISAVGELCNMIMGNACASLGTDDTDVDITPPTMVEGGEALKLPVKSAYNISLLFESLETIDFSVAL